MCLDQVSASNFQEWVTKRLPTHHATSIVRVAGIINRVFNAAVKFWGYPLVGKPMARVVVPKTEPNPIKRIPPASVARKKKTLDVWLQLMQLSAVKKRNFTMNIQFESFSAVDP